MGTHCSCITQELSLAIEETEKLETQSKVSEENFTFKIIPDTNCKIDPYLNYPPISEAGRLAEEKLGRFEFD